MDLDVIGAKVDVGGGWLTTVAIRRANLQCTVYQYLSFKCFCATYTGHFICSHTYSDGVCCSNFFPLSMPSVMVRKLQFIVFKTVFICLD